MGVQDLITINTTINLFFHFLILYLVDNSREKVDDHEHSKIKQRNGKVFFLIYKIKIVQIMFPRSMVGPKQGGG